MSKKLLFIPLALLLAISLIAIGCPSTTPTTTTPPTTTPPTTTPPTTTAPPAKDEIVLGQAISLSGAYATGTLVTQLPPTDMWIEEVNNGGGLYVEEYGKKLPLRLIRYDDTSDTGTAVNLIEKLIVEDKVDFVLGPYSTALWFATSPVFTQYKYPVVAPTVDSLQLKAMFQDIPYTFVILNQPAEKAVSMVELAQELGVKTMVAAHHQDLHGIEYAQGVVPQLVGAGIDLLLYKSFPLDATDLSPLLKEMKALNPDAAWFFAYPDQNILLTKQSMEIGFNPKLWYSSIGIAFSPYREIFTAAGVEGVMGAGAWNPKVPYTGAQDFWDRMTAYVGPENTDWYGNAYCYAANQVLEQAIVETGTLDREVIRDTMATMTFDTVLGPVQFVNQFNIQSPGEVGQWQNGEYEIIAAASKRTAEPEYPKPAWPTP
jgi:branched-chain amino acid transport system substrate-binding protein